MCATAIKFAIAALFASLASGQPSAEANVDRVFRFAHAEAAQDIQQVATLIKHMTEIPQASADTSQRTMALRGTAAQIALAEWLFHELDRPARQQGQSPVTREYQLSGGDDNLMRVFFLTRTQTVQDLQEIATLVRSITEIRWLFTCAAPKAVVLRGTATQVALAEWLFNELDAKRSQDSATNEYRPSDSSDDVVRVFYLTPTETMQRLQEIAVQVRTTTEARRLFIYNAPRAVAMRGTAAQVALADRLIKERAR